jgi:hypothetical protein
MPENIARFPVETISVQLKRTSPVDRPINDDVAYVVATRFNLRLNARPTTKSSHLGGRNRPDSLGYESYWQSRIDIFERVCLPSMLNLSPRPHAWFIAFGDLVLPNVRALFQRLEAIPWIVPYVAQEAGSQYARTLAGKLAEHARLLGKSALCTTRLDSDDSLHQQFIGTLDKAIEQLRTEHRSEAPTSLNFVYGLVESSGQLSVYLRGTNMFQSVWAPIDATLGPYSFKHDQVRNLMPLIEIVTNLPMWIYHRHDDAIDTPSALVRDRLPLTDPGQFFPLFGLTADTGAARTAAIVIPAPPVSRVMPELSAKHDRGAAQLRAAGRWTKTQRAAAVEFALDMKLAELAFWLSSESSEWIDAAEVLNEIERAEPSFLGSAQLVDLARLLEERAVLPEAVRAYERALRVVSLERDRSIERHELQTSS